MAERDVTLRLAVKDADDAIRRLRAFGTDGERALKRVEASSRPAAAGLRAVNTSVVALQASASRLVPALAAIGTGLAGLATGGVLAVAAGIGVGVRNSEQFERVLLRLEGVIQATGSSAGLTSRELATFADQMERTTLATGESVLEAAAALATFRSVSGETFTETLKLAQDLAATMGGNLIGQVNRLGRALEDPIRGIAQLREVGVSFSDSQAQVIRALVETGEKAEAQRKILEALQGQVGGAGAAEAGGLTGAFAALKAEFGDFLQDLGELSGAAGGAEAALRTIAGAVADLRGAFRSDPAADLSTVQAEIAALQSRLQAGDPAAALRGEALTALDNAGIRERIAALEEQERALQRVIGAEQGATVVARMYGEVAKQVAEEERKSAQLRAIAADVNERVIAAQKKAAEEEARAAERRADAIRKAISDTEIEVDQQVRLREALTKSVTAHDEVAAAIEVENELRAVGLTLQSEEGKRLAALVEARQDEAAAIDQARLARERAEQAAARQRSQVTDRLATRESRLADDPRWVREAIDEARRREAEIESRLRRQEQLVIEAANRFSSTVSNTLADFRNGLIDSADEFGARLGDILASVPEQLIGTAFTSLFDNIIDDFATQLRAASGPGGQLDFAALGTAFANPLGAATLGAFGGGIASQLFGIGGPNSAALGGIGAGLGFAVGGPIGGVIGGLGGTLLGGIGGSPRDNQGAIFDLESGRTQLVGNRNQNTQAAQQVGQQLAALLQALQGAGVSFDGSGTIRFAVNNGLSPERAIEVAIERILERAQGGGALLQTALANTQATTVEGVLGDVQFVRQFELLTQAVGPAELALRDLNAQFDDAARRARELGFEEGQLTDARTRAVEELVRSTEDQLRGAADSLRAVFDARITPLQGSLDQFTFGAGSALGVQTQLGLARSEFDLLAGRAAGGEEVDFNRLASLGTQVVGLARELDASGSIFQQTFADVDSILRDLLSDQERQRDDLLSAFDALELGQRDQTQQLSQRLDQLIAEFSQLTRAVELQGRVA